MDDSLRTLFSSASCTSSATMLKGASRSLPGMLIAYRSSGTLSATASRLCL